MGQQQYGAPQQWAGQPPQVLQKSQLAAALLAFFLGGIGAHNFYLGYTGRAVTQLVLFLFGWLTAILMVGFVILGGLFIWVFIEFILILMGSAGYDRDAKGVPVK